MAVTSAMVVDPGSATLSVDTFADSAVRAVHVFVVLMAAVFVNTSIN